MFSEVVSLLLLSLLYCIFVFLSILFLYIFYIFISFLSLCVRFIILLTHFPSACGKRFPEDLNFRNPAQTALWHRQYIPTHSFDFLPFLPLSLPVLFLPENQVPASHPESPFTASPVHRLRRLHFFRLLHHLTQSPPYRSVHRHQSHTHE